MFVRNENLIELNFGGEVFKCDPLEIGYALNELEEKSTEAAGGKKNIDEEFVETSMINMCECFRRILGDEGWGKCIKSVFGDGEAAFYDLIDMVSYTRGKLMKFNNSKGQH